MKKNAIVKIMAILAMVWIIISIVWTGILIIVEKNQRQNQRLELSPEELEALKQQLESMTGSTQSGSELEISEIENIAE